MIWTFLHWLKTLVRKQFIKHVIFSGDYADVLTERRKWVKGKDIIIIDLSVKKKQIGKKKITALILFYTEDSLLMNWLGFHKGEVHYQLTRH